MRRTVRCVLAAVMLTSFLAACGSDDDDAATSAGSEATELNVTVTEVGDQVRLDLPASIEGGIVNLTLTNSGEGVHSLQFVKVAGDHTTADIIAFLTNDEEGGPVPDWISEGGGIGSVAPGQTGKASFKLSAGKHIVWDDDTDANDKNNGTRGGIAELDVEGTGSGDLPDAVGTVSAKEYEFTVQNLKAGATTIRFENTGKEFHHFIAAPMTEGATLDQVKAFFAAEGEPPGPPPLDFEKGVGAPVLGAGNAMVANLLLKEGNYAMVCFINDRAGGPPHFTLGMLQQVTVAA
ncbi:MAG: hypothetical protein QOH36_1443 [Actinomycetota bacterium]|nr:hypothetical protein [Actinomycetota bacterium]